MWYIAGTFFFVAHKKKSTWWFLFHCMECDNGA